MNASRILFVIMICLGVAACGTVGSLNPFSSSKPQAEATQQGTQPGEAGAQVAEAQNGAAPGAPTELAPPPEGAPAAQTANTPNAPAVPGTRNVALAQATPPAEATPPAASQDAITQGAAPAAGSNSLAAAAQAQSDNADRSGYRVDQSGIGSGLQRRLNKILGGSATATPTYEPLVRDNEVIGGWRIEEEDGLRSCSVSIVDRDQGNLARLTQGCSPQIAAISNWDLFGSDLLLRNGDNEVVARLRKTESGKSWIGFTIGSGIPIFMSKGQAG